MRSVTDTPEECASRNERATTTLGRGMLEDAAEADLANETVACDLLAKLQPTAIFPVSSRCARGSRIQSRPPRSHGCGRGDRSLT
jgi:hypothetical protein